jgi:hypothetical protein
MSKAFTSEENPEFEVEPRDAPLLVPEGFKNYMTPEGARAFRDELHTLLSEIRRRELSWSFVGETCRRLAEPSWRIG